MSEQHAKLIKLAPSCGDFHGPRYLEKVDGKWALRNDGWTLRDLSDFESQIADSAADLLAENKRLTASLNHVRNDAKACAEANRQLRDDLRARAEAAEARLRELASAPPAAWQTPAAPTVIYAHDKGRAFGPEWKALIHRPEMPK